MKTILDNIKESDVKTYPFPHVVVENVLPEEMCDRLIAEMPPLEVLTHGEPMGNNFRFDYTVGDERRLHKLTPLWSEFLENQAGQDFFNNFIRLFGRHIEKIHPHLIEKFGPLNTWKVGNRFLDSHEDKTILLDAHIGTNTPTLSRPSSVREGHVDDPKKLYGALLYLRLPEDKSDGADLVLYRYRNPSKKKFFGQAIGKRFIEEVGKVKYKKNTLIFFLNSVDSLHGVTPRAVGPTSRHFLNLIGEMKDPIFDIQSLQENIWIRRAKTFIDKHIVRVHA
jgi:hypothetical protein